MRRTSCRTPVHVRCDDVRGRGKQKDPLIALCWATAGTRWPCVEIPRYGRRRECGTQVLLGHAGATQLEG